MVVKLSGAIAWTLSIPSQKITFGIGPSTGHVIYVTMGDPISPPGREAGFSQKRMDKAIELVSVLSTLDPHTIISNLMNKFPFYWINDNRMPPSYTGKKIDKEIGYNE